MRLFCETYLAFFITVADENGFEMFEFSVAKGTMHVGLQL